MPNLNRYRLPGLESRYSKIPRNKALLVILRTGTQSPAFLRESHDEIAELAFAASIRILDSIQGNLPHPSPSHFVREGKLEEIRDKAKAMGANVLVFNADLTPGQAANIETFTQILVLDRTGLILEIFGQRAQSKEGKLQVELAHLSYALPRLGGLGGVMSRLGGGIGGRGPGEQELERDRRKVRRRIQQVKEELLKVRKHRDLLRSGRKKRNFISVGLVGYTNAGKSTLLNALTGAEAYVENKLFATLDPLTRLQTINGRHDILFIDTVGFLKDLPHTLVESFRATLEEVVEADLLIHVLDISHPKTAEYKIAVEKVLSEIKAGDKPVILALNKTDLLSDEQKRIVQHAWPDGILISAQKKWGLNSLLAKLESFAVKSH